MPVALRPRQVGLTLLIALFALTSSASASPRIVNGVMTSAFPQTGALLRGTSIDNAYTWCSGTLIGCQTFLTAQHCVDGFGADDFKVFLQHGGMFNVASIARAPGYDFPAGDIAVLTLAAPVTGIRPARINTVQDPPANQQGTIVGFGRSGGANSDYGLKRTGKVSVGTCPEGLSNATSVCWNYQDPVGAPGEDSNTCNADSGGPLFMELGGETVVAGVTSGGTAEECLSSDLSYDADVRFYSSFIERAAGVDLDANSCGDVSQVEDDDTGVEGFTGTLTTKTPDMVHSVTVPAGTAMLRVALNGLDDGNNDFDLYLRAGSAPTQAEYDCARTGPNQYGVCEIHAPAAGTWYVMVHRWAGAGTYQVTATTFAPGCSDPSNQGNACDDGNPCTSNDQCSAGICQGSTAPDGTSCGAGDLCTGPLTCDAGACVGSNTPQPVCRHSTEDNGSFLSLRQDEVGMREKLQWKWKKGEQTLDFGDPTDGTDYALCIYDQVGDSNQLISSHSLFAGFSWAATASGFRYADRTAAQDGIRAVKLKTGTAGRSSIVISGKGDALPLPALPLHQDSEVVVQLVNSANQCWEGRFDTSVINNGESFKAKGK